MQIEHSSRVLVYLQIEYGSLEYSSRMSKNEVLLPKRAPGPAEIDQILDSDDLSFTS